MHRLKHARCRLAFIVLYGAKMETIMAALERIETRPKDLTPAPITDEEAAAAFRAIVNLFDKWRLTDEEAATLLELATALVPPLEGRQHRPHRPRPENASVKPARHSQGAQDHLPRAAAGLRLGAQGQRHLQRQVGAGCHAERRTHRHHARPPLPRRRARRLVTTDITKISTAHVQWNAAVRIIRSIYPPIDLFEDIADPADWPLLISIEQKTNPRLMELIGNLDLVPPDRRVSGPGASFLMAPFTHSSTDRPSRFSDGRFGVLYLGDRFEVALMETIHHHQILMASTNERPGWTSQFHELILSVNAHLHDLGDDTPAFADALKPDNYSASRAIGAALRNASSSGVLYPSVRYHEGLAAGLFYPDLASNVRQGRHLDYHWNGERVDFIRDNDRRETYAVLYRKHQILGE